MQRAHCAGRRFGAAFCVVIMLALYQLGTSGLMGVQDGMPAGVRGALLGGLAALLLPLLFLWPRSGGLLIQESHKGCCDEEEAFQHPGKAQTKPEYMHVRPRSCTAGSVRCRARELLRAFVHKVQIVAAVRRSTIAIRTGASNLQAGF